MRALSDFGWVDCFFVVYSFHGSFILDYDRGYFELAASSNNLRNGKTGSYFSRCHIDHDIYELESDIGYVGNIRSIIFSEGFHDDVDDFTLPLTFLVKLQ